LKQARHRASRCFLKDGARSSLPQYRQTSFSVLDAAADDRNSRRAAFLVFEVSAAFGLPDAAVLLAGAAGLSAGPIILPLSLTGASEAGLVFARMRNLLLGPGLRCHRPS
jgi:hypothetical protein